MDIVLSLYTKHGRSTLRYCGSNLNLRDSAAADKTPLQRLSYMSCRVLRGWLSAISRPLGPSLSSGFGGAETTVQIYAFFSDILASSRKIIYRMLIITNLHYSNSQTIRVHFATICAFPSQKRGLSFYSPIFDGFYFLSPDGEKLNKIVNKHFRSST
jgi:hypothetical protein